MTRPRYQPAICPADPEQALDRLCDAALKIELPGVDRLWLRNALQARRNGLARSIDEGLGLDRPPSPKKLADRRRHGYFQEIFRALQPCKPGPGSMRIFLILNGSVAPPAGAADACAALRADPLRPKSLRRIQDHLVSDADDPNSRHKRADE